MVNYLLIPAVFYPLPASECPANKYDGNWGILHTAIVSGTHKAALYYRIDINNELWTIFGTHIYPARHEITA